MREQIERVIIRVPAPQKAAILVRKSEAVNIGIRGLQGVRGEKGDKGADAMIDAITDKQIDNLFG
jgi:hypothetical protein